MTGASHVQMGDFDQAVDSLTACLEQNGGVVYANYLRGTCLLAAGKYEEAEKDFDAAITALMISVQSAGDITVMLGSARINATSSMLMCVAPSTPAP